MLIICKVVNCPYNSKGSWCGNPVLSVDENGMCSKLWKYGQPRGLQFDGANKIDINIIDGECKDARERDTNGDTAETQVSDGMSESSEEQTRMVGEKESGYSGNVGESGDRRTDN